MSGTGRGSWPKKALALSWVVLAGWSLFSLGKPLTMDQAWPVAYVAGAIAELGFDELGTGQYEIAHPTLYHHLLAVFFQLFGETDVVARLPGLLCALLVCFLLVRVSILAFPTGEGPAIGAIAALLYAVSPISIQHSLIADQTTTLLPVTSLVFMGVLYRHDFQITRSSVWQLALSYALCLWSHESIALLLLVALGIYALMAQGLVASLRLCATIAITGVSLFAVSWLLYCSITGVAPLAFVEFSMWNKLLAGKPAGGGSSLMRIWTNFRWLSAGFAGLLIVVLVQRAVEIWRKAPGIRSSDFLGCFAVVVLAVTTLRWNQLSRYQFFAYAVATIVVADGLWRWKRQHGSRGLCLAVVLGMTCAIPLAVLLEDPLSMDGSSYLVFAMVVPAAAIALVSFFLDRHGRALVVPVLLGVFVAVALWTDGEQIRPYTTSVSWTEYGERGFDDTRRYLEDHLGDSVPVIRKDLAYALLKRRPGRALEWIYTERLRRGLDDPAVAQEIEEMLLEKDVSLLVIERYSRSAESSEVLRRHFEPVQRFGDFSVFRKRAGS